MSVSDLLVSIDARLSIAKAENEKLTKGIRSSAPKLRAALLEIGKLVGESRKLALDLGKAIPVKKRAPKEAEPISQSLVEPISDAISAPLVPVEIVPASAEPVVALKKRAPRKPAAPPQPAA